MKIDILYFLKMQTSFMTLTKQQNIKNKLHYLLWPGLGDGLFSGVEGLCILVSSGLSCINFFSSPYEKPSGSTWDDDLDRRRKESVHDPFNTADKFTVRNTTAINKQIVMTHRVGHFRLCRLYWVTNETLESSQMRLWWIFTNFYTHSMTIPIIKLYQIKKIPTIWS